MAAISQGPQGLHRLLDSECTTHAARRPCPPRTAAPTPLPSLRAGKVTVLLIDGRHVVGHLKGYEQNFTLVLEQCKEMVYGGKGGVQARGWQDRRWPCELSSRCWRTRRLGMPKHVHPVRACVQEIDLGTYVVRGDAVAVVGELDEAAFAGVEWSKVRGETLGEMFKGGQT